MGSQAYEQQEEGRWIESQAMNDDDDDDAGLTDLFSDPDPLDTFVLSYELPPPRDQPTTTTTTTTTIALSGHKAELGQTLHSTGLTLWRASELLSKYLVQPAVVVHNQRVLELGAGLGLCGILAHRLGAAEVVLTDGDTEALANLRCNLRANQLCATTDTDTSVNTGPPATVSSHQLVWGQNVSQFRQRHGQFDVILGADIIYIADVLEPLWNTVTELLRPCPGSVFLLAYARRNVSIDLVLETASKFGFVWESPSDDEGVFVFWKKRR